MFDLESLVRNNIYKLKPYSCARDEFKGEASVYLDANENPLNQPYNRYPDPLQWKLKEKIARLKGVSVEQIFLGNGSDEPIDLLYRVFCEPGVDNVVAIDPSYGMYQVCADVNNVEYRKVRLNDDFSVNTAALLQAVDDNTKLMFLCSPNNPTGNSLQSEAIYTLLRSFKGIVVVDEAYIDFSSQPGFLPELAQYPNLVILQTFSKAWGLASVRLGMAFAQIAIVQYLNKVKYPYNINILTQQFVDSEIDQLERKNKWVAQLLADREALIKQLGELPLIKKIFPTDANFVLVKVNDANAIYNQLVSQGIIVRNRNTVTMCEGCLRITVGTQTENDELIRALRSLN